MTAQPTLPTQRPDWSSITEEVCCPLWRYNLHGLAKPRCPKCGYTFEWPDLLDSTRHLHPYLFEHHPERNLWSFRKTLTGALRPRRFWRSVHPTQPSNRRRLLVYWLLTMAICLVCGLGGLTAVWIMTVKARIVPPAVRAAEAAAWNKPQNAYYLATFVKQYGSLDAYLDTYYPDHLSARVVWRNARQHVPGIFLCLEVAAWPAMSFLALLVFRISMRRARIKPIHVLRRVVYSGSTLVWVPAG